jgi:uncharacterized membrane protein
MILYAKRLSQMATHVAIAYALAYALTGSAALSGLAIFIEPALNVALLPSHEKMWLSIRARAGAPARRAFALAGEKISQTALHAAVAFGVMWVATGSVVVGGLMALLEPICNVIALPLHDRLWLAMESRMPKWKAIKKPAMRQVFSYF